MARIFCHIVSAPRFLKAYLARGSTIWGSAGHAVQIEIWSNRGVFSQTLAASPLLALFQQSIRIFKIWCPCWEKSRANWNCISKIIDWMKDFNLEDIVNLLQEREWSNLKQKVPMSSPSTFCRYHRKANYKPEQYNLTKSAKMLSILGASEEPSSNITLPLLPSSSSGSRHL